MGKDQKPKVSIGLPVYNGENFLSEEIESILKQSFTNFELIISDNASNDNTEKICRNYARTDKRIRYFKNKTNLGAAKNYNQTFQLASGEYFKWAAHDDVLEPEYLQRCVDVLDNNPDIVLCQTEVKIIDKKSKLVEYYKNPLLKIGSPFAAERFGDMVLSHHACFEIFGLIRADVLKKTKLHGNHLGADRNLLAELTLYGRLYKHPEYLFNIREHMNRSVRVGDQSTESKALWFDPQNKGRRMYEHPRYFIEYVKSIHKVPLTISDRAGVYRQLFKWAWREKLSIANDIINDNPYVYRVYRVYSFFKYIGREKPIHKVKKIQPPIRQSRINL